MGQWVTPPILPPTTYCRRLLIPDDPQWIGTVTGALMDLIYASNWVQTTGITPDEAATRAQVMFDLYLNSGNDGECGDMACCEDQVVLHRYDPETGQAQISVDDGMTWTVDPAATENVIPLYPPIVHEGSTSTKCDAATNASEHINELITATGTNLATAATVFDLAAAVAEAALAIFVVIVSGGTLSPLVATLMAAIWGAATGALALGIDAYNTYWTTDKKDAILCAIFNHIGDNGQFTEDQYQAFRAEVKSKLPASPAFDIVMTTINAGGARGLSQMASYGNAADADCGSCSDSCDLDNWTVLFGTEVSRDASSITATPTFNAPDGKWHLQLTSINDATCCYAKIDEAVGGGTSARVWVPCGEAYPTSTDHPENNTIWFVDLIATSDPGMWRVIFSDAPIP